MEIVIPIHKYSASIDWNMETIFVHIHVCALYAYAYKSETLGHPTYTHIYMSILHMHVQYMHVRRQFCHVIVLARFCHVSSAINIHACMHAKDPLETLGHRTRVYIYIYIHVCMCVYAEHRKYVCVYMYTSICRGVCAKHVIEFGRYCFRLHLCQRCKVS